VEEQNGSNEEEENEEQEDEKGKDEVCSVLICPIMDNTRDLRMMTSITRPLTLDCKN
jgi:hypothetical protein